MAGENLCSCRYISIFILIEYQSIVEDRKNADEWKTLRCDLSEIQRKAKIWSKYRDTISMSTLNLLLTFVEMSQEYSAVEKIEEIFNYICESKFEVTYMIRKLKKEDICKKVLVGMRKSGKYHMKRR